MASPFANILAALAATGVLAQQVRERNEARQLRAAQLLQNRGSFVPVSPEEVPQQNPLARFFGQTPPNHFNLAGQTVRFQPYPQMDIPGFGQVPVTPELAFKKMLQDQERATLSQGFSSIYGGEAAGPTVPLDPFAPQAPMATPQTPGVAPTRINAQVRTFQPIIEQASRATGLPVELIQQVMMAESAGDPNAVSPKGALGPMQLMPQTAQELGVDPRNPAQNIMGGARYLQQQIDRFGGDVPKGVAAYNAGAGRVQAAGGIPAIPETQQFVQRVTGSLGTQAPTQAPKPSAITPADRAMDREIQELDREITRLETSLPRLSLNDKLATAAMDRINRLTQRRDRLEDQLTEPARAAYRARAVQEATAPGELSMARQREKIQTEGAIEREKALAPVRTQEELKKAAALTPVYAERARQEAEATEAVRTRLAQAARELTPVAKEQTDKVDALMQVKAATAKIREILAKRGQDPEFAKGLKGFTGPLQGIITQYLSQPMGGADPDESDFVTALRTLQSQEIRAQAGLAQTGTEVERAIGAFQGRLPVIFNPPDVFESRMKAVIENTDRALRGQARNVQGRQYGQFIQEFLDEMDTLTRPETSTQAPATHRYNPDTGRIEPVGKGR